MTDCGVITDLLAFEFAHLLIFGVSMVYLITTLIACNRLQATSMSWKRIANGKSTRGLPLVYP